MTINGVIFSDEAAAQAAIDEINAGEGIPVSDDAVTRTYTSIRYTADNQPYILADAVTLKYLTGEVVQIEI